MKITKFVEIETEVEVDVSIGDIVRELPCTAENVREMLSGLSGFIKFCDALPDDLLAGLNEKQHSIILEHFDRIHKRFAAVQVQPAPVSASA
ncbi:hypothetical protein [Chromobacterium haemolyticum]|uniref:hypothetical protein n=1 Tax=Chromobacterium haemolyticum TaxID=394935 RepID=UPI00244AB867|nr:hypothetical protein [Chromobacterium haemolyticum]MDH0342027.1 hypothetical protein [Chromobacterium haemolyticum]